MPIKLNGFYGWQLVFLDPVHEISRSLVSWCYFLNFLVKEKSFHSFDCFFKYFLVQNLFGWAICVYISTTFFVSSSFRIFSNINTFRIFIPKILQESYKFLYYFFQHFAIRNISGINIIYYVLKLIDKIFLFLTMFDDGSSFILNKFLIDNNIYY